MVLMRVREFWHDDVVPAPPPSRPIVPNACIHAFLRRRAKRSDTMYKEDFEWFKDC